jgi:F-type H+-transporting ATPase subunit alpha
VAANLRLDLAQYEEVKAFARFGAILDEATKRQIGHGQRLTRLLMQAERHVAPLVVQVAELWALKSGRLADLEPHAIADFDRRVRALAPSFAHLLPAMQQETTVSGELAEELERWIQQAGPARGRLP